MKGLLVVNDLDGALLDDATHDPSAAAEARCRLEAESVPLVLASSKTRAEMDEPFLVDGDLDRNGDGDLAELLAPARRRRLRVSRGGRFFHPTGATDKGRALRVLLGQLAAEGRLFRTLGLGDAPNDLPLLEAVDEAVLVPRPDGRVDEDLRRALPGARVAPSPGPAGWNAAVLARLEDRPEETEPRSFAS
jgi:mannosyl-3-phosphoglycerate phosphatase